MAFKARTLEDAPETSPAVVGGASGADAPSVGRLGRTTTMMVFLTTLASIANYGSNLVFSRLLTPSSYGDLTALLSISVIVAVPTAAAQTLLADRVAVHMAEGRPDQVGYLIRHAVAHIGVVAMALGVLYTAAIPALVPLLDLQAIGPAIALMPLLMLSFFMPVIFGVLQGMDRFVALGLVLLGVAISRIAFGVPWTLAGGGAGGPIIGQAFGCMLALAATAYRLRPHLIGRGTGAATTGIRRRLDARTWAASGAFIAFALISNLDVLLAKLLLPAYETGQYAALATIEKVVIFLPGAVAVVMVPNAARARMSTGSATGVLRIAALLVVGTTLLAAVPAALAPGFMLDTMFGRGYRGAVGGVLPIVCAGAGLALLYLMVVYTVAIQNRRWVWLLIGGVVLQIVAIALFHSSAEEVARVQAIVVAAVLVVNELAFHPIMRTERWIVSARRLARTS